MLSSNLAQTIGALRLASGFYGPAEGPPAMRVGVSGILEPVRPPRAYRKAAGGGFAVQVLAAIPEIRADDVQAINAGALPSGELGRRVGLSSNKVCAYLSLLSGVERIGERRAYRYYRPKVDAADPAP